MAAPGGEGEVPARRVLLRSWLAFSLLAFANELGTNAYGLWLQFHQAKVLNALTDELRLALDTLAHQVLVMLALAAACTALVWLPWAAVCSVAWGRFRARHGGTRVRRVLFWFVAGFSGFHLYYSLHDLLLPSSRACDSPLVVLGGAFDAVDPSWSSPRLLLLPLSGAVVVGASLWALAHSRTLRRGALAFGLLGWAGVVGYERVTGLGPPRRFEAPGSVIVLGLDSFQANRLPLGGAPAGRAPHIDGFLRECYRFDNAWTPFARTYPSWVSIFTGRYPMHHGVRDNLVPDSHLAPDNRYLAAELRRAGYATLHATDETRFSNIRAVHGFERLLHPTMGLPDFLVGSFFDFSAANLVRQSALGHDLFPLIANNRAVVGYNPRLWVRSFLRELDALPADRPLFVTAHLCGNHWPFSAPFPYWLAARPGLGGEVDACVDMVDEQVGLILDHLRATGLMDAATVVLMSDHGDGWSGDPADVTNSHGDNLERLLANKVLLGIHRPGLLPGSDETLVRSFDLYPTVLELAGLPADNGRHDGLSLLPLLAGQPQPPRTLFAETGFDKKTFLVSRLVQEQSNYYGFDPQSGLITLTPEGYDVVLESKSYMLLQGDLRLLVAPGRGLFRIARFDARTGDETDVTDEVPVDTRRALLEALVAHYGLRADPLLGMARRRGFLEST